MTRLFASLLLLLLPGLLPAQEPLREPISVEADRLEMDSATGLSTYQGNVEMRQGNMLLRADTVVLHSRGRELQMAVADGSPVYLEQTDAKTGEVIKANALHVEYRIAKGQLEMKEQAHLWRGKDEFSGDHIIYDLSKHVVRAFGQKEGSEEGRVRVILQPRKEEQQ
jgi:lipopolysaccharide export system protein LptA